ncbi:hypothetical protein SARC_16700, partial [Sphaeroforma arctica JP610]
MDAHSGEVLRAFGLGASVLSEVVTAFTEVDPSINRTDESDVPNRVPGRSGEGRDQDMSVDGKTFDIKTERDGETSMDIDS